jgi:hypothetical protein
MKRFFKIIGHFIHKLARGLGYLIIVAAIPVFFINQMAIDDEKATARTFGKFETFVQGLEEPDDDQVVINGLKIPIDCFSYLWNGGDNYEYYYESYTGNEANYEDDDFRSFIEKIGNSMGSIVPINDALYPDWLKSPINLSPRVDQCDKYVNYGHVHKLVMTPKNLCKEYAPHLDKTCLGTVLGEHDTHQKRISKVYGVYGIYQGYEEVAVIVPLRMYRFRETGNRAAQFLVDAGWNFNLNEN